MPEVDVTVRRRPGPSVESALERRIGKNSSQWEWEDLLDFVERECVRVVSLMHVGGDGWLKSLDFTPLSREHLHDVFLGGERADGSSLFTDTGIDAGASDIVLRPRLSSAFLDPFAELPTLVVLCEHLDRQGRPLAVSPDTVVKRADQRLRDEIGIELWALGEVEYFLGKKTDDSDVYGSNDRGYHATAPFVFGAELRRKAMAILADIGVAIKYGHSEVGWVECDGITWEQHEIELALAPLPAAADAVVLTQWVLRNLAAARGMSCSFEPVIKVGHAGSGSHFHFSPVRNGEHLGGGEGVEQFSDEAKLLISGLVTAGGALMAWGNRKESSFVRLAQGKETPETITWGRFNRHALVRLPIQSMSEDGSVKTAPTIEFRLPDGSVHPHLLLAGVAQAMLAARHLDDLDQILERSDAASESSNALVLPRDRAEVAAQLGVHADAMLAGDVFSRSLIDSALALLSRGF